MSQLSIPKIINSRSAVADDGSAITNPTGVGERKPTWLTPHPGMSELFISIGDLPQNSMYKYMYVYQKLSSRKRRGKVISTEV